MNSIEMEKRKSAGSWLYWLGSLLALIQFSSAFATPPEVCIPNIMASSPAQCAYDVWGYVMDGSGVPFPDVQVSDGPHVTYTDENGFFDLTELTPGNYAVGASYNRPNGCTEVAEVSVALTSAIDGGVRQDFMLPCFHD